MKESKTVRALIGAVAVSLVCAVHTFAIEGLQLQNSLQSSNVILSWPSASGESYIVQFRTNLTDPSWLTLTSSLTADPTTNIAVFVHWGGVNFPYPGSAIPTNGGGGGGPMPGMTNGASGGTNYISGTGFYQVVRDGVHILNSTVFNLTNGILSNNVTVAFEAGNAANDGTGTNVFGVLNSAVLLIDGTEFPGDQQGSVLDTSDWPWQFNFDSAYLQNGTHTLQVEVIWNDTNATDDNYIYPSRYSDPITITVTNLISYPNWEPEIGETGVSAYFLQTVSPNVPWSIAIYDVNSNLVQTLTNVTAADGTIDAYWNMVDTNGVTRTNADLDPEFTAVVTVYDAPYSKRTPTKKQRHRDWPAQGVWTVAYLDYFKHFYSDNNDMQGHINDFADTAGEFGGYYLYYPTAGQTNDIGQTYPLRYQNPKHPEDGVTSAQIALDSALLKVFLSNTNSRNFFFRGHGSPTQIGYVQSSDLAKVIKHRYRFVLLQECKGAAGKLDRDFGINGPGQFSLTYYENTGIRPAAFVGSPVETPFAFLGKTTVNGVTYDGTIPWEVPYFYYNFLFFWDPDTEGYGLQDAISSAISELPSSGLFPEPGTTLVIFGYTGLQMDQFNHSGDTW